MIHICKLADFSTTRLPGSPAAEDPIAQCVIELQMPVDAEY